MINTVVGPFVSEDQEAEILRLFHQFCESVGVAEVSAFVFTSPTAVFDHFAFVNWAKLSNPLYMYSTKCQGVAIETLNLELGQMLPVYFEHIEMDIIVNAMSNFQVSWGIRPIHSVPFGSIQHLILRRLHKLGVFAFISNPEWVGILLRPTYWSENDQLHCATGPAVCWPDGHRAWFWHGVAVPQDVIEAPEGLTADRILNEPNTEVQRCMIERVGWDRFHAEAQAELVEDHPLWGALFVIRGLPTVTSWSVYDVTPAGLLPIRIAYVRVENRSPEPDGSFRRYILPVHPELRPLPDPDDPSAVFGQPQQLTALNAVASTFGMTGRSYAARLAMES